MKNSKLKLKVEDKIICEVTKDKQVIIKKAMLTDIVYLKALESTLSEWNSQYDDEDSKV